MFSFLVCVGFREPNYYVTENETLEVVLVLNRLSPMDITVLVTESDNDATGELCKCCVHVQTLILEQILSSKYVSFCL